LGIVIGAAVGGLVFMILVGLGIWFCLSGRPQSEDEPKVVVNLEHNVLHDKLGETDKGTPPLYDESPGLPMQKTGDENVVVVDVPAAENTAMQADVLKMFQRYDLDGSGTINTVQEAEQLMFNVLVTHDMTAKAGYDRRNAASELSALVSERPMDFEHFWSWLESRFVLTSTHQEPIGMATVPTVGAVAVEEAFGAGIGEEEQSQVQI